MVGTFPPGPRGLPLLGSTLDYLRDPLGFLSATVRDHGDASYFKAGPLRVFILNRPEYIEKVLVQQAKNFAKGGGVERLTTILGNGLLVSEGDLHARHRELARPAFRQERIASYGAIMSERAAHVSSDWREGSTVDVAAEMSRLTWAIMSKTVFDVSTETVTDSLGEAVNIIRDWAWRLLLPVPELAHDLPLQGNQRFKRALAEVDAAIYRHIREHRESGEDKGDILSMLLRARDVNGKGMSDAQVRDEVMTIFLAGYETSACALTWTLYLLSQHLAVEAQLQTELDRELGGRQPAIADVPKLWYLEMVISETLRLYPPAWSLGRKALNDFEVGTYLVPAGSVVVVNPYIMHHDPRYYPDPFKFDPLRWTPEEKAKRPSFSYLPFGGGETGCLGERFAWMEIVLSVATIAQEWQMRLAPGHKVEVRPLITLGPRGHVPLMVTRRTSGSGVGVQD